MPQDKVNFLLRFFLIGILVLFLGWAMIEGALGYLFAHYLDVLHLTGQHLHMVGIALLLAMLIALPLGILVTRPRFKKLEWLVVNFANIGQTIPTLAILALAMSYLGLGFYTAVFALWFSSLLPILRNTISGIRHLDPAMIDAAKGMGMTPGQILINIELPNASQPIIAGIRTSLVLNIGAGALAFLVGGGGLGNLIFTGIALYDNQIMLAGAIPVTLLAILLDYGFGIIEKIIVPKGLQRSNPAS